MASASDYVALLPSVSASRPKFAAMVGLVAGCFAGSTNAAASLPAAFDLDAAVGPQLDAVGAWAGISRRVTTPLTGIYFAFDTANLGFEQGYIQGPFDPSTGVTSVDDPTYRTLIRAKIQANSFGGTIAQANAILNSVFGGQGSNVFLQDNFDMTMTLGWSGKLPTAVMRSLFVSNTLQILAEGVGVSYLITSVAGAPIFGFDVQNSYVAGFDTGAFGLTS